MELRAIAQGHVSTGACVCVTTIGLERGENFLELKIRYELFWTAVLWSIESANVDAAPDTDASLPRR